MPLDLPLARSPMVAPARLAGRGARGRGGRRRGVAERRDRGCGSCRHLLGDEGNGAATAPRREERGVPAGLAAAHASEMSSGPRPRCTRTPSSARGDALGVRRRRAGIRKTGRRARVEPGDQRRVGEECAGSTLPAALEVGQRPPRVLVEPLLHPRPRPSGPRGGGRRARARTRSPSGPGLRLPRPAMASAKQASRRSGVARAVAEHVVARLRRVHGDGGVPGRGTPRDVASGSHGLCASSSREAERVLARPALGGLVEHAGPAVEAVQEDEPERAADRGVGAEARAEEVARRR